MNKWISVKERLPVHNELVLMTDGYDVIPGFYASNCEWCEIGYVETALDIFYWMEFRSPPEEK